MESPFSPRSVNAIPNETILHHSITLLITSVQFTMYVQKPKSSNSHYLVKNAIPFAQFLLLLLLLLLFLLFFYILIKLFKKMNTYLWKKKVQEPEVVLPERDALVLEKYTRRMKKFDEMIKVCCCWVGYDVLLGMLCFFLLWVYTHKHSH